MEAIANAKSNDQTRQRILSEAERLFAENGFNGVSVRKITTAAGVNLASVNYHFGNKHNLYMDVFRYRWLPRAYRVRDVLAKLAEQKGSTPQQIIRSLAISFLTAFDQEELRLHLSLMGREIGSPGEAFELVTREAIRPLFNLMDELLGENMVNAQSDTDRFMYLVSIFGQILYFTMAQHPISSITGKEYDDEFRERIADHITNFSLLGLGINGQES